MRRTTVLTRTAPRWQRFGRLLALCALALQLSVGSIALPQGAVQAAAVDAMVAVSICHGGPASDHQHPPASPLRPLLQAIVHAATLIAPAAPALAAPVLTAWRASLPPPSRAPPSRSLLSAFPRGPPRLV